MIEAESTTRTVNYDSDDDLDVERDKEGVILIGTELIIVYSCINIFNGLYLQSIAYLQSSVWSVCKYGELLYC